MIRVSVSILLLGLVAYLLFWPVPIDPVIWEPGPDRQDPAFDPRTGLERSALLLEAAGTGPEDVTRGPDGAFYAGMLDGRVLRFDESGWSVYADTGGRPLGLQFDGEGRLIVADAFAGLLSIDTAGAVTVLVDKIDGVPMRFPDDLDIAEDGTIWFTDASRRFDLHHWQLDFWEGRGTGRLLSYQPATGELAVHLDGLMFANGVALGPEDSFVLVNETLAARTTRLWLKGPDRGKRDVFLEGLPGYPDNLSFDGEMFWIALPSPRQPAIERLADRPWLRTLLQRLPARWRQIELPPLGWVIAVDAAGRVRESLQDTSGRCYS
ncbi:MAG: SMP-30/gluconolactonase/LRE family protein, partial [Gammaproteobacteria bacterium]